MESAVDPSPQSVVEKALVVLIETHGQAGMRRLFGTVAWEGDPDEMRASRSFDNSEA